MADPDDIHELLKRCEKDLQQLKKRAKLTEAAPATFGVLAERVDAVIEERRREKERRSAERETPDRRRAK